MKKTMKAALCILSAVTMSAAFAVSASAGTLSREELIEKYMPDGAQDELYFRPGTLEQYYDAEGELMDVYGITQQKMDDMQARFEAGELSQEDAEIESMILANETFDLLRSTDYRVLCFNDYRRGIIFNSPSKPNKQYFVNAEYENGFWYVLQADGTASVVGAEQTDMEGKTVLDIPAEIGGVPVTRIEDRAFEQANSYFLEMTEIVIPDTVEYIGEGAFSWALRGKNCKINMPANVKYIGKGAFCESASWLVDEFNVIQLPESLEYIGFRAFDTAYNGVDYISVPESPVLIEEHRQTDSPRYYQIPLLDSVSYADVYLRDHEEVEQIRLYVIECIHEYFQERAEITAETEPTRIDERGARWFEGEQAETYQAKCRELWLKYYDKILNAGLPLNEMDKAILQSEYFMNYCNLYGGSTEMESKAGTEETIRFCEKYNMDQHLMSSQRKIGSIVILNAADTYIDLDDVDAYYAGKIVEPKPAAIAKGSGDADCSGTVDVTDSVLLARYCSEDQDAVLTAEGKANADANGDGALTMDDVSEILQIIAKLK